MLWNISLKKKVGPTRCGREGRTRRVREVKKVKHENCIQSNATKKRRRKLHQQLPCFCKPSSRNTTNTSINISDKKLRKFNKDKTRLHPHSPFLLFFFCNYSQFFLAKKKKKLLSVSIFGSVPHCACKPRSLCSEESVNQNLHCSNGTWIAFRSSQVLGKYSGKPNRDSPLCSSSLFKKKKENANLLS